MAKDEPEGKPPKPSAEDNNTGNLARNPDDAQTPPTLEQAVAFEKILDRISVNDRTLSKLDLRDSSLRYSNAVALAEALEDNTFLTKIDLRRNALSGDGARALADALIQNSRTGLTHLLLRDNAVGDDGAAALAGLLKLNTRLTTLDLQHNGIGNTGATALAEALATNKTLVILDAWENTIGNHGAKALADALKLNTTLATLHVGSKIGNKGASALAQAVTVNKGLIRSLAIGDVVGDAGALALATALEVNTTLSRLWCGCNVGDAGATALAGVLAKNNTLESLDLWNNRIGDAGAIAIAGALATNRTLKSLILPRNQISNEGATALAAVLAANHPSLAVLLLNDNRIGTDGAIALAEALQRGTNTTLVKLDLTRNSAIGDEGSRALAKAVALSPTVELLFEALGAEATAAGKESEMVHLLGSDESSASELHRRADVLEPSGKGGMHGDKGSDPWHDNNRDATIPIANADVANHLGHDVEWELVQHRLAAMHFASRNFWIFTVCSNTLVVVSSILSFWAAVELAPDDNNNRNRNATELSTPMALTLAAGVLSVMVIAVRAIGGQCNYRDRARMHGSLAIQLSNLKHEIFSLKHTIEVVGSRSGDRDTVLHSPGLESLEAVAAKRRDLRAGCESVVPWRISDAFVRTQSEMREVRFRPSWFKTEEATGRALRLLASEIPRRPLSPFVLPDSRDVAKSVVDELVLEHMMLPNDTKDTDNNNSTERPMDFVEV